jgi:diguanylate cyclase (GGDEF)-like protein/PAS domain S-box-containing protein
LIVVVTLGVITILQSARLATDLEMDRKALEIERDRFFDLSLDMLSVVGADGRFQRVNSAWETTLGYRADELVGHSGFELIHPDDLERATAESRRPHDAGDQVEAFQSRLRHKDGSYRWFEWVSRTAPDGSVAFAVARDVTDRKRKEDRRVKQQRVLESRNETLEERAVRDPLTGLHNRRYFDAAVVRLERRWGRLPVDQRPSVSVIIFDLDHFGMVNKQYGHQTGDTVLRVFSTLLKKRFREQDLVARYGGEEFVAVLQGATATEAIHIAEDIRVGFERASIDIGTGTPLRVTVSAGCAQVGEDGNASAALSVADVWLSQAKRAGRNQVVGL